MKKLTKQEFRELLLTADEAKHQTGAFKYVDGSHCAVGIALEEIVSRYPGLYHWNDAGYGDIVTFRTANDEYVDSMTEIIEMDEGEIMKIVDWNDVDGLSFQQIAERLA